MIDLGFTRCFADFYVYIRYEEHGKCIVRLHVDNFVAVRHTPEVHFFIQQFSARFSIKELGLVKFVVGLQILQQGGEITLSQSTYVNGLVAELLETTDTQKATVPISDYDKKTIVNNEKEYSSVDPTKYKKIIRKVMYAAIGTRVDVLFALGFLGKFAAKPTELHMKAAKNLLRYMKTFLNVSIHYKKRVRTCKFISYVDSN